MKLKVRSGGLPLLGVHRPFSRFLFDTRTTPVKLSLLPRVHTPCSRAGNTPQNLRMCERYPFPNKPSTTTRAFDNYRYHKTRGRTK